MSSHILATSTPGHPIHVAEESSTNFTNTSTANTFLIDRNNIKISLTASNDTCSIELTDNKTTISCPVDVDSLLQMLLHRRDGNHSTSGPGPNHGGEGLPVSASDLHVLPNPVPRSGSLSNIIFISSPASSTAPGSFESASEVTTAGLITNLNTGTENSKTNHDLQTHPTNHCAVQAETFEEKAYSLRVQWPCPYKSITEPCKQIEVLLEQISLLVDSVSNESGSGCVFLYKYMSQEGERGIDLTANFIVRHKKTPGADHDSQAKLKTPGQRDGLPVTLANRTKDLFSISRLGKVNDSTGSCEKLGLWSVEVNAIVPPLFKASLFQQWLQERHEFQVDSAAVSNDNHRTWKLSKNFSETVFLKHFTKAVPAERDVESDLLMECEPDVGITTKVKEGKYFCFSCTLKFDFDSSKITSDDCDSEECRKGDSELRNLLNACLREVRTFLLKKCCCVFALKKTQKVSPSTESEKTDLRAADVTVEVIMSLNYAVLQRSLRRSITSIVRQFIKDESPWRFSLICECVKEYNKVDQLLSQANYQSKKNPSHSESKTVFTTLWLECFDHHTFQLHFNLDRAPDSRNPVSVTPGMQTQTKMNTSSFITYQSVTSLQQGSQAPSHSNGLQETPSHYSEYQGHHDQKIYSSFFSPQCSNVSSSKLQSYSSFFSPQCSNVSSSRLQGNFQLNSLSSLSSQQLPAKPSSLLAPVKVNLFPVQKNSSDPNDEEIQLANESFNNNHDPDILKSGFHNIDQRTTQIVADDLLWASPVSCPGPRSAGLRLTVPASCEQFKNVFKDVTNTLQVSSCSNNHTKSPNSETIIDSSSQKSEKKKQKKNHQVKEVSLSVEKPIELSALIDDFRNSAQLPFSVLAEVLGLAETEPESKKRKFSNTTMLCRGASSHNMGNVKARTVRYRRQRISKEFASYASSVISAHICPEDRKMFFSNPIQDSESGTGECSDGPSSFETLSDDVSNRDPTTGMGNLGRCGRGFKLQSQRELFARAFVSNTGPWLRRLISEDDRMQKYQIRSEKILRRKLISELFHDAKAARCNVIETMSFLSNLSGSTYSVRSMRVIRSHLRTLNGNLSTMPSEEFLRIVKRKLQEKTSRDLGMMPTRDGWRVSLRNQVEREVLRYLESHRASVSEAGGRVKGRTVEFNRKWQDQYILKLTFDARHVSKKVYHTEVMISLLPTGKNIDFSIYQCQKPLYIRTVLIWMGKDTKEAVQANMKELFEELRDLESYGIIFREQDCTFEGVLDGVGVEGFESEDDLERESKAAASDLPLVENHDQDHLQVESDNVNMSFSSASNASSSHRQVGLRNDTDTDLAKKGMKRVQIKFILAADMAAEASVMGHGCHGEHYCLHCLTTKSDRTIPFELVRTKNAMDFVSLAQSFQLHSETFAALNLRWPASGKGLLHDSKSRSRKTGAQSRRTKEIHEDCRLSCYHFQEQGLVAQTAHYIDSEYSNSSDFLDSLCPNPPTDCSKSHGSTEVDANMFKRKQDKKRKRHQSCQANDTAKTIGKAKTRQSPDYDVMECVVGEWLESNCSCSPIVPAGTLIRIMRVVSESDLRKSEWLDQVWPNYKNRIFPCVLHCKMRITECLFLSICDMVQNNGVQYVERLNQSLGQLQLGKALVKNSITKEYEKLTFLGFEADILLKKSDSNDQSNISNVLDFVFGDNNVHRDSINESSRNVLPNYVSRTKDIWKLWASIVKTLEEKDPRELEKSGVFDTFERDCRKFVCLVQTQFHGDYCKSYYLHTLLCHAGPAMRLLRDLGLCLGIVSNSGCERRHEYGRRAFKRGFWGGRWREKLRTSKQSGKEITNISVYLTLQELMIWEYGQDFISKERARVVSSNNQHLNRSRTCHVGGSDDSDTTPLLSSAEVDREATGAFCIFEDKESDCSSFVDWDEDITKMENPMNLFSDAGSDGESDDSVYYPSDSDVSDSASESDCECDSGNEGVTISNLPSERNENYFSWAL